MCKVKRKTITHVNKRMIAHVKKSAIPVQNTSDGQITVSVYVLGNHKYKMPIEKVNEIYGRARRGVIGASSSRFR